MYWRHVVGSAFSATEVLEQVRQLNNNMNETLNNWKNGLDDGYFNNIINGGAVVDDNSYKCFYVIE